MTSFIRKLEGILPSDKIFEQEPMNRHTTFRVGGPADYYLEPGSIQELAAVLKLCREEEKPYFILGNGSNLLVSDKGYRGVMIAMGKKWSAIRTEGTEICAGAGALLSAAARRALDSGLSGLEFASGIPGTAGGAVVMNAGAYGSEMKEVLVSAEVLLPDGEVRTFSADQLELDYRTSCILKKKYVVLEVRLKLKQDVPEEIRRRMETLALQRRLKQPLEYPSAGSTFKRPKGYFAGKLIEDAGMRGFTVGGAQVSEKHCGFVINRGGASASDIMRLCREVQRRVREKSGVEMELEVKVLGEFGI